MSEHSTDIDALAAIATERRARRREDNIRRYPSMRVTCPYCGAQPGDECKSKGADVVAVLHKARRQASATPPASTEADQ